jgi:hypothetical protein
MSRSKSPYRNVSLYVNCKVCGCKEVMFMGICEVPLP